MIKIGDKVRFLNSTGGGIVKSFQGKNIVLVEEEDGFETPALVTDVVVVQETNELNFVVNRTKETPHTSQEDGACRDCRGDVAGRVSTAEAYEIGEDYETAEGEQLSLFLAFVPSDYRHPGESEFEIYIVNDSNYYVTFAVASAEKRLRLRYNDTIEPQTKLRLETIKADDLNEFESLRIQAFAYKKREYDFKPAVDTPLKMSLQRFFKMHSFVENDFFDENAMLVPIVRQDFSIADIMVGRDGACSTKHIPQGDEACLVSTEKERKISKPNAKPELIEIDLHINALMDNTNGLSPKDMLDYQMGKFNEVMRANLKRKGTKIVFIHGKGEGALRAEILRQLKFYYPKCEVQDANFQKYGFGASMVTIH